MQINSNLKMCGICGVVSFPKCEIHSVDVLKKLRHRGYDSWGVATFRNVKRSTDALETTQTFNSPDQIHFEIGHTRYTTQGTSSSLDEAQPMSKNNITLVHNGQVWSPNPRESDTLHLLDVLQHEISELKETTMIFQAIQRVHQRLSGSYACIALIPNIGMIAFRDPRGIRPLVLGMSDDCIVFASESYALPSGCSNIALDILPGQCCLVNLQGNVEFSFPTTGLPPPQLCLFEFIYLAHDDSVIDGISVREARKLLGSKLIPRIPLADIDVIVPVPHTPVLAGKQISAESGVEYVELLNIATKKAENRTFILPTTEAREHAVRQKFEINHDMIERCRGRRMLLLDDSIVRGTTLRHVIRLIREVVQPSKLLVASLAPPIISPNKYGIDIPDTKDLIAKSSSLKRIGEQVGQSLGLDGPVIYQSLETITQAFGRQFEDSVFRPVRTIGEILGDQF